MASVIDMGSLPDPVWGTNQIFLRDVVMQCDVPNVAKIVKGQFMNLGVSKLPFKSLQQEVIIHSIKTNVKVLAHSLQRFDGRDGRSRLLPLDQRLSIPLTYQGWFELLSEDGRSAKPIDSVFALAKLKPQKCLVRQNIQAYMANNDGRVGFDNFKVVPAGEQLTLCQEILAASPSGDMRRLLKCKDSKGTSVYLDFEQRGIFNPIAKENDITGVLTIKDIVTRFRLPITVKLIQGVWPRVECNRFTGIVKLDWAYTDETAFLCPIEKGHFRITPVPTEVPLKLQPVTNSEQFRQSQNFKNIMIKCNRMVANYNNTIHLILAVPEKFVAKNKSHAMANMFSRKESSPDINKSRMKRSKSKEDVLMDDVDELYQYLRDGRPPPKDKFTYESDEESYFEEPAYEHIDEFRSRLAMMDKGQPGYHNSRYKHADMTKMKFNKFDKGVENNPASAGNSSPSKIIVTNGHSSSSPKVNDTPPPVPPRRYERTESAPAIRKQGSQDSSSGSSRGGMTRNRSETVLQTRRISQDSNISDPKQKLKNNKVSKSKDEKVRDSGSSATSSSGKRPSHGHLLYL